MSQNIFDNETFFNEYRKLREGKSYNDLLEQPAMRALLPGLTGKRVLDIGCGFGHNCLDFINRGASRVMGIDLSQKMLSAAQKEASHPGITYRRMDMAGLSQLVSEGERFDLIYSSLAFHYAEDFPRLMAGCFSLLHPGGVLLWSQEHPIVTATLDCAGHFNQDEQGNPCSYTFSDYAKSGRRVGTWFVEGVVNYHRPMGEILTTLAHAGFVLTDAVEPTPSPQAIKQRPDLAKEFIKPPFLIIRAKKPENPLSGTEKGE